MLRLFPLALLTLLLAACDTTEEEELTFATVTVDGGEPYRFAQPMAASLDPVPEASTVVFSFVLTDRLAPDRRIRLDLSAEVAAFMADTTYVLDPHRDVARTGDGQAGLYARFLDCPVDPDSPCTQEYVVTNDPRTQPFVQVLTLTDTEVTGAFGFQGVTESSASEVSIRGTFALPLGE